jgi:hypothetical protein
VKLLVPVAVEAPEDATHYSGHPDDMGFYKRRDIGAAGEHWFGWTTDRGWVMVSHHKPHWIEPIPEEWKLK